MSMTAGSGFGNDGDISPTINRKRDLGDSAR